ncbi:MAG TPA: DUF1653 domain-containing protein [Candidatus Paceibacterota bacterium]|nr:DUF1653 domain-containing protein [Candidatus Paceibacterota bacterium]
MEIQRGGIYQHFKDFTAKNDKKYEVIGIANHSEHEGEQLVIYRAFYGEKKLWVRPVEMFLQEVDRPELGYKGPRFVLAS